MKAHRLIATLGVAALALSLGIESKAAPLILDGDGRLVTLTEGRPSGGVGAFHLVASNGAPQFDVVLDPTAGGCCAHAEQHSSLLPTGFSGSGSILTGGFDAATENRFDVTFEVSAVTAFQLDGSITGDSYVGYFAGANLQTLSGPFSISGLLEPGVPYEIWLDVLTPNGAVPSTGQWQLTFTVPEPALGLLSLGAFAALALTRRRESPLPWRLLPAAPLSAR